MLLKLAVPPLPPTAAADGFTHLLHTHENEDVRTHSAALMDVTMKIPTVFRQHHKYSTVL